MWHNIFSNDSLKGIKYLTYTFVILSTIWLTIAIYYYCIDEIIKGTAALVSCASCLLLTMFFYILMIYFKKKALKESIIGKVIEDGAPLAKAALATFQVLNQNKNLIKAASTVTFLLSIFYLLSNLIKDIKK
jgi:uncharacterized membrane protein (DUF485 family)